MTNTIAVAFGLFLLYTQKIYLLYLCLELQHHNLLQLHLVKDLVN